MVLADEKLEYRESDLNEGLSESDKEMAQKTAKLLPEVKNVCLNKIWLRFGKRNENVRFMPDRSLVLLFGAGG